jgi:hypothetical protein
VSDEQLLAELRFDTALLASQPETQQAWLAETGFPTDELGEQFGDAVLQWCPILRRAGLISEAALLRLQEVDAALSAMSGMANEAEWMPEALATSPRWANIRVLAAAALDELGGDPSNP